MSKCHNKWVWPENEFVEFYSICYIIWLTSTHCLCQPFIPSIINIRWSNPSTNISHIKHFIRDIISAASFMSPFKVNEMLQSWHSCSSLMIFRSFHINLINQYWTAMGYFSFISTQLYKKYQKTHYFCSIFSLSVLLAGFEPTIIG